jgi:hypothetical protein
LRRRKKNITMALDEGTLEAGRAFAQRHDTTLNALVRSGMRWFLPRPRPRGEALCSAMT